MSTTTTTPNKTPDRQAFTKAEKIILGTVCGVGLATISYLGLVAQNITKNNISVPVPILIERRQDTECDKLIGKLRRSVDGNRDYVQNTIWNTQGHDTWSLKLQSEDPELTQQIKDQKAFVKLLKMEADVVNKACKDQGISFEIQ